MLPRAGGRFRMKIAILAVLENGCRTEGHNLGSRIEVLDPLNERRGQLGLSRCTLCAFVSKLVAYPRRGSQPVAKNSSTPRWLGIRTT